MASIIPATTEVIDSFTAPVSPTTGATNTTDVTISKNFPALSFAGTEANAVGAVTREISGDWYFMTNADYALGNFTCTNIALPAFALRLKGTGNMERLYSPATSGNITWTVIETVDLQGAITTTPTTFTANTAIALSLAPTWNAPGAVMTAIKANVTDTSSNAASLLLDLQVGGVSKFSVSKTGAITNLILASPLPISSGGTGSTTAAITSGANIGIAGTFPNQVISFSGTLPVANGGTGTTTLAFVDLSTAQSVGGAKTFTAALAGTSAAFSGNVSMLGLNATGPSSAFGTATVQTNLGFNRAAGFTQLLFGGGSSVSGVAGSMMNVNDYGVNNALVAFSTTGDLGLAGKIAAVSANISGTGLDVSGSLAVPVALHANFGADAAGNAVFRNGSNAPYYFQNGSGGTNYLTLSNGTATFNGAVTLSGALTGATTGAFASDVTIGGVNHIIFNSAALGGQIRGDGVNNLILQGGTAGAVYVQNGAGSNNNAHFPDLGGLILDRGGLTSTAPAQAASDGATRAYVPPVYTASGAALGSTTHIVKGQVTAAAATTTLTFTGASAFTSTAYSVDVFNLTAGAAVTSGFTAMSTTSITFPSTSTNVYNYVFVGA